VVIAAIFAPRAPGMALVVRGKHKSVAGALPGSPFLTRVSLREERMVAGSHPFTLPWLTPERLIELQAPVTFLVGENGTGKSTLLEGLAWACGFGAQGGARDNSFSEGADGHGLGRALRLGWRQKVADGFFLRAETFFNFATYLETVGSTFRAYGGESLHTKSHGEAFLALFQHRFEDGLYLLDEPEAALSPQRQLAFLRVLHDLGRARIAQFIIATHSPMLLTLPKADILCLDGGDIRRVSYQDTDHYRLTNDFLDDPERFYRHLLADEDSPDGDGD
jgi:predicted ATPase